MSFIFLYALGGDSSQLVSGGKSITKEKKKKKKKKKKKEKKLAIKRGRKNEVEI